MIKRIAVVAIFLWPALGWTAPATRPAEGSRMGPRVSRPPMLREPDWEQALKFFEKYSPNRFKAYNSMDEGQKSKYRMAILSRYHSYSWLSRDNPELQQIKAREIGIEDNIFDLKRRLDAAYSSAEKESLQEQLKKEVGELVELRIKERQERISRLEKIVTEEKARLEKDQQRKEQLVEKRYREILNAGEESAVPLRPTPGPKGPPRREK